MDYERNLMLRSAVERQFEIIGEALNHAEIEQPELATLIPDLRRIVGLRNRIIHGYDSVDDQLLWQMVHVHVPHWRSSWNNCWRQTEYLTLRSWLRGCRLSA